jgi:hypothetical protein
MEVPSSSLSQREREYEHMAKQISCFCTSQCLTAHGRVSNDALELTPTAFVRTSLRLLARLTASVAPSAGEAYDQWA